MQGRDDRLPGKKATEKVKPQHVSEKVVEREVCDGAGEHLIHAPLVHDFLPGHGHETYEAVHALVVPLGGLGLKVRVHQVKGGVESYEVPHNV